MCTKCIIRAAIVAAITMTTSTQVSQATPAQDAMAGEARGIVKSFATDLKHTLVKTIKSQGPVAAIAVYYVAAPKKAQEKDTATGFKLGDLRGAFTLTKPLN